MNKAEFKKAITEINKGGKVHVKVLLKELGDAMDNSRTMPEWFKPGTEFAEVTVGEKKIKIVAEGKFIGQLVDGNGNMLHEFDGFVEPVTEPINLSSNMALKNLMEGFDENFYMDYQDADVPKIYAVCDGEKTEMPYKDVIESILAEDFFVSTYSTETGTPEPEEVKEEALTEEPDPEPVKEEPKEEIPEQEEKAEKEEVKEKKKRVMKNKKKEEEARDIRYDILPLDVMAWFITEDRRDREPYDYNLLLNMLADQENDKEAIKCAALEVCMGTFSNTADMLLCYAEERTGEKMTLNDIVYHFLKSISGEISEEEKEAHKRQVLWALLDMLS